MLILPTELSLQGGLAFLSSESFSAVQPQTVEVKLDRLIHTCVKVKLDSLILTSVKTSELVPERLSLRANPSTKIAQI